MPCLRLARNLSRGQLVRRGNELCAVKLPCSVLLEKKHVAACPTHLRFLEPTGGINAPGQGYASRLLEHRIRADFVVRPIGAAEKAERIRTYGQPWNRRLI